MGWKCVPQTIGCVRGEPKAGQKNRCNGRLIAMEALEERASASTTLDRSRSGGNTYWMADGIDAPRGADAWDWVEQRANEWRSVYTDKNGKERSRALPKQSVVALATIIHPPVEISSTWTDGEREKFYDDAWATMAEIDPVIYSGKNMVYRARHTDEGKEIRQLGEDTHEHRLDEMRDAEGRYIGSTYDANWRTNCAKQFAVLMREKGWDIDDPELTDWGRYKTDEAYKAEIDAKRSRSGLSQKEYHEWKAAEAQVKALEEKNRKLESDFAAVKKRLDDLKGEKYVRDGKVYLGVEGAKTRLKETAEELTAEREKLSTAREELGTVEKDLEIKRSAQKSAETARDTAIAELETARSKLAEVQSAKSAAQARVDNLSATVNEAVQQAMLPIDALAQETKRRNAETMGLLTTLKENMDAAVEQMKAWFKRQFIESDLFTTFRDAVVRLMRADKCDERAIEIVAGYGRNDLEWAYAQEAKEKVLEQVEERIPLSERGIDLTKDLDDTSGEPLPDSWDLER